MHGLMKNDIKKNLKKKSNCALLRTVAVWNKLNGILWFLFLIGFIGYSHKGNFFLSKVPLRTFHHVCISLIIHHY